MSQSHLDESKTVKLNGFQNLLPIITILLVFLVASRTPLDSDLWWHLHSGQIMSETGRPLVTDMFSFTRGGETWINHSWLGQVIIYQLFRLAGWTGLSTWMGLTAALIAAIVWRMLPGGVFTRAGFVLLASVTCSPLWTPRPQFFSLLFFAVLILFIKYLLKRQERVVWIIPVFFIFWSNIHGGYMTGILFLVACSAGLLLDAGHFPEPERRMKIQQSGTLILVTTAAFILTAVNPNGWRMWTIPFETIGVNLLRQFIQEWASPDFHAVEVWPFAAWLLLLLFSLGRAKKTVSYQELLPALFFILLAIYARRNIAVAVIASAGILTSSWLDTWSGIKSAEYVPVWMKKTFAYYQSHRGKDLTEGQKKIVNLVLVGLLGLFSFFKLAAVTHPVLMDAFETRYYPKKALDFLRSSPLKNNGNIFNAYNWGGYIAWKEPDVPVFVDGRTDLYGDEILGQWVSVMQADNEWEIILEKWNITRVIIEPERPLVRAAKMANWAEVYRDEQAVILDRANW